MNKIKISALAVSVMLLGGNIASAASFTDMPQDAATSTAIENAVANGLLSGYEDNTVRPDANIKRSEMAAIITRACKVDKEGDISRFTDVTKDDWFYSAMAKAYEMGAFSGDGNNMNPENNITFQECFTVLSQVFDLIPPYTRPAEMPETAPEGTLISGNRLYDITALDTFSDKAEIADWAKVFIAGVVSNGGWSGVDGKITPKAYITRAQFSVVMDNLIKNYIDEPGTYTELPDGNTMIRCDGVILENITTDDDIYIGDSVSANGITVNNVTANKRFVIRGCATPAVNEEGKLSYGEEGITVTGHFEAMRVIRPYINLNMSAATYGTVYSVRDTNLSVGISIK
ncbi:MAG: S-layer homology domain-containing protein [Clostridia bacterium]|nr:S-layer homology domain-containing protein [Clostridia bacterium]MBP3360112.1 S-layer homology domain-containing protein [Clostridia bacterium]